MHLIQQIGSYAGLAAIPGLAVLAALYFSQARDVRRLRDWAGRAPERAAEQAGGGRVAAAPQAQAAAAAKPAAPAVPGTAAATPAAATPAAATAAGAKPATAAATTAGKAATPAGAAAGKAAAAGAGAAASGGGSATGTVARPGPPAVGGARPAAGVASGVRRPVPRVSSQTSILTPTSPPHEPWYRRAGARLPAGRYIALIVAGILVLGGGAAYALTQLGGSSSPSKPAASRASSSKSTRGSSKKPDSAAASTISPSSVTVTVVNGTSTPNLARDTATKLSGFGFQIGNKVTGTGTLAAAESVVEYKPGAEDQARLVADKLNINQKQPADGDALAQAGIANVIVVLGADQAPGG